MKVGKKLFAKSICRTDDQSEQTYKKEKEREEGEGEEECDLCRTVKDVRFEDVAPEFREEDLPIEFSKSCHRLSLFEHSRHTAAKAARDLV